MDNLTAVSLAREPKPVTRKICAFSNAQDAQKEKWDDRIVVRVLQPVRVRRFIVEIDADPGEEIPVMRSELEYLVNGGFVEKIVPPCL